MTEDRYPVETLGEDEDNGTMPANVERLGEAVIGRRIVSAERAERGPGYSDRGGLTLTLDDGTRVRLVETSDCCAHTDLGGFLLHPDKVDHVIMGVGTTNGYTKWHVYADLGDVLEMDVNWSCGNPFYYGYGFDIAVEPAPPAPAPSDGDLNAARWAAFTDGERELIRHGLRDNIASVLTAAAQDEVPKDDLRACAGTLLLAQRMDLELDETEGLEHPPLDMATIEAIAEGSYPAIVRDLLAEGAPG